MGQALPFHFMPKSAKVFGFRGTSAPEPLTIWGFLLAAASHESGVVDDGNFWRFEWLLLRKLQQYYEGRFINKFQMAPFHQFLK